MKKDCHTFINEFTNNYADLFVETFLIKYLDQFPMSEFLPILDQTLLAFDKKLKQKIIKKLKAIGYDSKEYQKYKKRRFIHLL